MRKKIVLLFSLMFLVCGMLILNDRINVMAAVSEDDNSDATLTVYWKTGEVEVINTTPGSDVRRPLTRGNALPTMFSDLTKGSYIYSMIGVKQFVNTDCYFNTDSSGRISISTDGLNSGNKPIKIILYKYNGAYDTPVSSWTGNPQSIQGLGFNNLNTSYYYWFRFETVETGTTISGSGIIHHP